VSGMPTLSTESAVAEAISRIPDPEIPVISIADLGILRDLEVDEDARALVVTITPTYSGCPAMAAMRDDLVRELRGAGFDRVEVRVSLDPAWTTDWITPEGRAALAAAGISPPGPAPSTSGPIPLTLLPTARQVRCPQCDSPATELVSEFGSTACKAQYRCTSCLEPFDHVKEI